MKPKINIITNNNAKFETYRSLLGDLFEIVKYEADIPEIQSFDQSEILKKKLIAASELVDQAFILDETAIYFDKYPNFPGPFAKFAMSGLGMEAILRLFDEGDPGNIKTTIGFKDGDKEYIIDETTTGKFTKAIAMPINKNFPYMSFFIPTGYDLPFSLLKETDQNNILPRAKAINKLKNILHGLHN